MKTNTDSFRVSLRLEAAVEFLLLAALFGSLGGSWLQLAALFLLPDLSMLGYLHSPRWGARLYNSFHKYVAVGAVLGLVYLLGHWQPLWLVWPIHIAFDRAAGYGLKSEEGFHFTHLARP